MNALKQNAKEIFAEALALTAPAERRVFLDRACVGNAGLRAEVESLLRAHEQAGDFLGKTIQLTQFDFTAERPGTLIGRYKLLEQIGAGGFGVVWMAEEEEAPAAEQEAAWRAVLAADARCGVAYASLSQLLVEAERYADFEKNGQEFLQKRPELCAAHLGRAVVLLKKNDWEFKNSGAEVEVFP